MCNIQKLTLDFGEEVVDNWTSLTITSSDILTLKGSDGVKTGALLCLCED